MDCELHQKTNLIYCFECQKYCCSTCLLYSQICRKSHSIELLETREEKIIKNNEIKSTEKIMNKYADALPDIINSYSHFIKKTENDIKLFINNLKASCNFFLAKYTNKFHEIIKISNQIFEQSFRNFFRLKTSKSTITEPNPTLDRLKFEINRLNLINEEMNIFKSKAEEISKHKINNLEQLSIQATKIKFILKSEYLAQGEYFKIMIKYLFMLCLYIQYLEKNSNPSFIKIFTAYDSLMKYPTFNNHTESELLMYFLKINKPHFQCFQITDMHERSKGKYLPYIFSRHMKRISSLLGYIILGNPMILRIGDITSREKRRIHLYDNSFGSVDTIIKNDYAFICGGESSRGKYLNTTILVHFKGASGYNVKLQDGMKYSREMFSLASEYNLVYCIGGISNIPLKECEKFELNKKIWVNFPSMNFPNHSIAVTILSQQFLYCFCGAESSKIEYINLKREDKWIMLNYNLPGIEKRSCGKIFDLSEDACIIYGGKSTLREVLIFTHSSKEFMILQMPCFPLLN